MPAGRYHSFAHQLAAITGVKPRTVLEVGVGNGFVESGLELLGYEVSTLDYNADTEPDLVGDVTDIPAEDDSFDVVSCCQVLEHLHYEQVPAALAELRRVAAKRVVISLPDVSRQAFVWVRLPRLGQRRLEIPLNFRPRPVPGDHVARLDHKWEIGYRGYPLKRVRATIEECGMAIEDSWRVPENPWHHFFALRP